MKALILITLAVFAVIGRLAFGSRLGGTRGPEETAYFRVGFGDGTTFVVQLTGAGAIQEARDIVAGRQTDRVHVMGTVIKASAWYNPPWSYHLDPGSIRFFAAAVEVCDANPNQVESFLGQVCGAFLPDCVWCPWSSRVEAEVERPAVLYLPLVQD